MSSTPVISVNEANLSELSGKSTVISLDGTDEKTLVFRERDYATAEDVQEELSAMLDSAFGQGRVSATLDGNNITLGAENSVLSLRVPGVPESDPSGILDFGAYATNRIDLQVSLSMSGLANPPSADPYAEISFSINGKVFTFEYGASLSDIIRTVNNSDAGVTMSYSRLTDKFTLTSKSTGSASSVEINDISGSLMNSLFGAGIRKDGTDAVVKLSLNGSTDEADMITLTRSSNTFEIDGTTYKLLGKAPGNTAENINIKLDYDTDAIVEKITSFINDYNELLGSLIKLTSEEVFRDYKPLTEDEKKALTDDEIKLWTEKAKSGILRSDTYLKAIETELRSSMFSQVDVIGSLASIGITTILYSEKGKLHIDKDKLKNALETDIEKTLALFTNKSEISFSLYASPEQQETRYNESGVLWRISI